MEREGSRDVKVLYVLGWGRSGSTLLDTLLGQVGGFFSTGELHSLWRGGIVEGRRCGCGVPVRTCSVWTSVLATAFGDGAGPLDIREVIRWERQATNVARTLRVLAQTPGRPSGWSALDSYTDVAARLYGAVAEVTGTRVIVDSSKAPAVAALLRLVRGVRPYVVHLVRDPRAVVHSWQRRKEDPDRDFYAEMDRYTSVRSAAMWATQNLAAEAVRQRYGAERSLLVRYEDFVEQPHATLRSIVSLVDEPASNLPLVDGRVALLDGNHTVSGNPARFAHGRVVLRRDDEWHGNLAPIDRLATTAVALPLLRRYGYPITPKRSAAEMSR